jgi:hypothetical protein
MSLLAIVLAFPTVPFTVLLALSLLYWLFVLLGALDHNLLGGGDHAIGGVAKGGLDALAHTGVEGAAEGVGHEVLGAGDEGALSSLASALKLRSAPLTVVITLFAAFGFLGSGLGALMIHGAGWPLRALLFIGASVVSLLITSLAIRPLQGVFETRRGLSHASLVGQIVVVTTAQVTPTFGQARLDDKGTSLSLAISADGTSPIRRGARCVLIDWNEATGRFAVEPLPDDLGEPSVRVATASVVVDEADPSTPQRFDARRGL